MLKVEKINFFYGEMKVLSDISLEVNDGEFILVLGPNGHGKSTLLKNICGLLKPISGKIEYNGEEIHNLPVQQLVEKGIVYIPEDRNLFKDMTVLENLLMGAYNKAARIKEKENLDFVYQLFPKLKNMEKRRASLLSGGEARMLAIGRGIMSNPKFFAIDEPSLGLAPNLKSDVYKAINEIRQTGASVFLVEQNTSIVAEYANKIYVLENGEIIFGGTKEEALNNERVRKVFLGF
jgi:branched-chain amino acid transport system ATP-binding protein